MIQDSSLTENGFEEMLNTGEEIILESKKVFKFRSQVINFDYKFVLNITDFSMVYEGIEEGKEYGACLMLVPTPEYVNQSVLRTVVENVCGTLDNFDVEVLNVSARDLDECGFSVLMAKRPSGFSVNGKFEGFSFEEITAVIELISNTLLGFETHLDGLLKNKQNMLGETGWKLLLPMLNNEIHDDSML